MTNHKKLIDVTASLNRKCLSSSKEATSGSSDIGFIDSVKTLGYKNGFNINSSESEYPKFEESRNIYKHGNPSL